MKRVARRLSRPASRRHRRPVLGGALRGSRWIVGSAPPGAWLGTLDPDCTDVIKITVL
jgi:hypothetical protein